jgi:hypothetical protein
MLLICSIHVLDLLFTLLQYIYNLDRHQPTHSWAIYHIRGTPAQFIGIVFDQPDEQSALKRAIEEYDIPENQRNRLMARRRD